MISVPATMAMQYETCDHCKLILVPGRTVPTHAGVFCKACVEDEVCYDECENCGATEDVILHEGPISLCPDCSKSNLCEEGMGCGWCDEFRDEQEDFDAIVVEFTGTSYCVDPVRKKVYLQDGEMFEFVGYMGEGRFKEMTLPGGN